MSQPWREVVPRSSIPVVIISFNQLEYLRRLLDWLVRTGHENIVILDNASTFEPLIEFLDRCEHEVVHAGSNRGQTAPWDTGLVLGFDGPFVVTDPDVLPCRGCPANAVEHFQELLLRHEEFDKAGFGLRLDDIPDHYPHRDTVREWERPFWEREVEPGVYAAHIDTTFSVHRPRTPLQGDRGAANRRPVRGSAPPLVHGPERSRCRDSLLLRPTSRRRRLLEPS